MAPLLLAISAAGCIPVAGETVTAARLAERVPALASLPGATIFGFAPRFGVTRQIPGSELRAFARRNGVVLENAPTVCVVRPTRRLTGSEVREALKEALTASTDGRTEQVEIIDFSHQPIPPGVLKLEPRSWVVAPSGDVVLWRGVVQTEGGGRYPVWAKVRLAGARQLLRRTAAAKKRDVKAGQVVAVEAAQGNARLSIEALAETSGYTGQRILLKNPESGRRFAAVVSGPGRASIGGKNDQTN